MLCAQLPQSCPTLCDHVDYRPPDSSVHGLLQARILGWVAMPSSRGSSRPRDRTHVSYVSCIGRQFLYHYCHLWLVHVKAKFLFSVVLPHEVASLYCGLNEKQYSKCRFTKYLYGMASRRLSNHRCTEAPLCGAPTGVNGYCVWAS